MTLLVILVLLSFLVIIHEIGHYLSAKLFKIKVEEFGLGYPPKAVVLFKKRQTEFTLNWVPFGGFVRMEGEDGEVAPDSSEKGHQSRSAKSKKKPESAVEGVPFYSKPAWQRLVVILAGAAVNFGFGVLAFSIFFSSAGLPTVPSDLANTASEAASLSQVTKVRVDDDVQTVGSVSELQALASEVGVRITAVAPGSPAESAGLQTGTRVLSISAGDTTVTPQTLEETIKTINSYRGQTITLEVSGVCAGLECESGTSQHEVYVRTVEETPSDQGAIGVAFANVMFVYYPSWQMPFRGSWYGLQQAIFMAGLILSALGSMVTDLVTIGAVPDELAGPVGIVYQTHQSGILNEGWLSILNFAGILSVNLAIMNVLPIPALDGGRAVFILIEMIWGKTKFNQVEGLANYAGYILLLGLIIAITLKDIWTTFW